MSDYLKIFRDSILAIKSEGRYRIFTELQYDNPKAPVAFSPFYNKEITVWCSNDYLGMSHHDKVIAAMIDATKLMGAGSGGTRNISGTNSPMVELEKELADLHNKEAGLVFTSGYISNQATLSTLTKIIPGLVVFSDELNHASIIQGIRDSKAVKHVFRHSDTKHLEELLKSYPTQQPKLIVFESVYSMLGDIAPLKEICDLAKHYNALTYIDEVHSAGLYGERGAGIANDLGVDDKIDIIQGTLAKAFGVIGGYITAKREIIDSIRLHSPGFIFTTSLPPGVSSAALASVRHLKSSDAERNLHQKVINKVKAKLTETNVKFIDNGTHIIPVMVNDPFKCQSIGEALLRDHGIYIQHINFPTVPKGKERLRITPTPLHTDAMIEKLADALSALFDANNLKQAA